MELWRALHTPSMDTNLSSMGSLLSLQNVLLRSSSTHFGHFLPFVIPCVLILFLFFLSYLDKKNNEQPWSQRLGVEGLSPTISLLPIVVFPNLTMNKIKVKVSRVCSHLHETGGRLCENRGFSGSLTDYICISFIPITDSPRETDVFIEMTAFIF